MKEEDSLLKVACVCVFFPMLVNLIVLATYLLAP